MLSVEFNVWAENLVSEFKQAGKIKKKRMIDNLQTDVIYLQSSIDSYQRVLNQLKDMEE